MSSFDRKFAAIGEIKVAQVLQFALGISLVILSLGGVVYYLHKAKRPKDSVAYASVMQQAMDLDDEIFNSMHTSAGIGAL